MLKMKIKQGVWRIAIVDTEKLVLSETLKEVKG